MNPFEELRKKSALAHINRCIAQAPLAYHRKEIFCYTSFSVISLFFAYSASMFLFQLGSEGTELLPIGHFSNATGGTASMTCNTTLNWYFMVSTMLSIRTSYYHHQILRQLEIPPKRWKSALKILIAVIFSLAAASVATMIASSRETHFQRACTFGVNALLNFHGSIALLNLALRLVNWLKQPRLNCPSPSLKTIPHVMMQSINVIFNYGYVNDTVKNLKNHTGLAIVILMPFISLCALILYETTHNIIHLLSSVCEKRTTCPPSIDDPKRFLMKGLHTGFGILFVSGGYFLSYLSTNTTLALNAQYGWNDWWNVWPSVLGTISFNGYGFFQIFQSSYYLLDSSEKRLEARRKRFYKDHPHALTQLARTQEIIGLLSDFHQ